MGKKEPMITVWMRTAQLEHELEMLPHSDPDIKRSCKVTSCHLPSLTSPTKDPVGRAVLTPNEMRLEYEVGALEESWDRRRR